MPKSHTKRMSLSEHLEELRGCVFRALIGLFVGAAICWLLKGHLMKIARYPLVNPIFGPGFQQKFLSLSPTETIITYLKMSILGGSVLASPWITYQLWRFIGAGLYPKERWIFYRYAGGATLLFLIGVAFSYFIMTPIILGVLLNFTPANVTEQKMQISRYFSFFFKFTLAMGASFQVPMIMRFLSMVGIVDRSMWINHRKYAIVGACFLAALITPPDPISMGAAALPIVVLYELGILLIPAESSRTMDDGEESSHSSDEIDDKEETD